MKEKGKMDELIRLLHDGGYSCVIRKGEIRTFTQRGVADLYDLLSHVCNQYFYYSKRNRICMKGIASAFTSEEKRVYCDPYWGNRVGNQLLELPL